ncbi:hypothetical protein Tco_0303596 [Tanacetum coccineum]
MAHSLPRHTLTCGFSWNSVSKLIEAEDEVWEKLIEAKPEAAKWRTKPINLNNMLQLFGKDRATANEVCFENLDNSESIHATSAATHSQVKLPNATKIKSRKRKLEEDDALTSKIMSALKNLSDAIDRSTKVMESSCPHVYSEREIYQELELMGLDPCSDGARIVHSGRPKQKLKKRIREKRIDNRIYCQVVLN